MPRRSGGQKRSVLMVDSAGTNDSDSVVAAGSDGFQEPVGVMVVGAWSVCG
jgi:hypothetical protein